MNTVAVPSARSGSIWKMPPCAQSLAWIFILRSASSRSRTRSPSRRRTCIGPDSVAPRWSGVLRREHHGPPPSGQVPRVGGAGEGPVGEPEGRGGHRELDVLALHQERGAQAGRPRRRPAGPCRAPPRACRSAGPGRSRRRRSPRTPPPRRAARAAGRRHRPRRRAWRTRWRRLRAGDERATRRSGGRTWTRGPPGRAGAGAAELNCVVRGRLSGRRRLSYDRSDHRTGDQRARRAVLARPDRPGARAVCAATATTVVSASGGRRLSARRPASG